MPQKLSRLRERRIKQEQQLAALRTKEKELAVTHLLTSSKPYQAFLHQVASIRGDLHLIRVNLARKAFSLSSRKQAIAQIEKSVQDYQRQEAAKMALLKSLEDKLATLKKAASRKV